MNHHTVTRRSALGAAAAPFLTPRAGTAQARPNLVFILIDDLRWDALGSTGHPFARTPNIDRIGREGAVFRNAFVTTPLCSPSRASFLTGRYAHSHGVRGNGDSAALSHQLITWPRLLRDAGYATAYVGKWHMGNDPSPRPGFDRWVSFRGQGVFLNPPLNIDGRDTATQGYMTDILSGHAVDFIRQKRNQPFALYLAHKAVHGPFTPADRHKTLYADESIRRRASAQDPLQGKPALTRMAQGMPAVKPGGGSPDELIRNQLRCLASIDEGIGKVFAALEDTGALDNTLLVFTSDNGYFWGEHGLGDKRWAYEESIRIPLLMRWPGKIRPGTSIDGLALNIDIAPTLLEAGGVKVPANVHGRSLAPLFPGTRVRWRSRFLCEYFLEDRFPRTPSWQAVRSERWKYIHYPDLAGMDELYDLQADPLEMRNRIGDPAARGELARLQTDLQGQLRSTT